VPISSASEPFSTGSRYQSRMDRGENEPLAICATSTVTVTTKPVRAATAPTIADRTVLAVDGEYAQSDGTFTCESIDIRTAAPRIPMTAPRAGTTQRLSRRYSRILKRLAQLMISCSRSYL